MKALLNGFESNEATFRTAISNIPVGRAVVLQSSNDVYYPVTSTDFTGIIASCKDGVASVVMKGYAVAAFKDTLPHIGICKLAPTTEGYMEINESEGKPYTVVGVDAKNKTLEIIL